MSRRNAAVADPTAGHGEEPTRFGVRDPRNSTAGVLEEAERSGAVYIGQSVLSSTKRWHRRRRNETWSCGAGDRKRQSAHWSAVRTG
jgi:hypothetical protein